MNPLTPSEVRRRGDRMRRRNNGVMALGAAAAVAVVATSGVFVAGALDGTNDSAPGPAGDPSPTVVEDVNLDGFPIAAGLGGVKPTDEDLMGQLEYCGQQPLAGLSPAAVRSAEMSGGDASVRRTVYLLDSPEASVAAHQSLLDAAGECAEDPDNEGDIEVHRDGEGWPGSTVVLDRARGEQLPEPAVDVVDVVSAGSALLVTSTATYPAGDIDKNVATVRSDDQKVMLAMADFGEYDAPAVDADQAGSGSRPAGVTSIPDDFALDSGWPDDSQAEPGMGLEGPDASMDDLEFQACEQTWQEPEYVDRLRANWTNVEDGRARQLTTYDSADDAVAAVEDLISQQQACPADPEREDGYVNEREVRQVELGGEAWAILERDTMDGNDSPFGASSLVVRVGNAVLVVQHTGHSGYPSGNGNASIDAMSSQASTVIAEMCVFTDAGC